MKKKYLNIILAVVFSFGFILNVNASQEEIDNAAEATAKYCDEDAVTKGCIYNPNDKLYTHATGSNENFRIKFSVTDAELTRGYQAANANGEMVFAGCYKVNFGTSQRVPKEFTMYIFKIVGLKNGKCKQLEFDMVPAKGTTYKFRNVIGIWNTSSEYSGVNAVGDDAATYKSWVAKNNGECPLIFGLTANTRWYTSNEHRYVFGNDASGFDLMTWSFWGNEKYETNPGCTVQDKTGHAEAEECFNNAAKKIENKTCPTDLANLATLHEDLQKYQDECQSKFEVLYSKGLLEEDAEEFSTLLKEKSEAKINECYYGRCNVTTSEQSKIATEQAKSGNSKCKDGCSDATDTACMDCLKKVYKDAGLNDTKISCMLGIEEEKENAEDAVEEGIDTQFDEDIQQTIEENKEYREFIANYEFEADLPDFGFGEEGSTCYDLLGQNLTKIVNLGITAVRIAGAIIAIVNGMITLIPPIVSKDADALKKAGNKCIRLGIILLAIGVFPTLVTIIGRLFGYDLSCIV